MWKQEGCRKFEWSQRQRACTEFYVHFLLCACQLQRTIGLLYFLLTHLLVHLYFELPRALFYIFVFLEKNFLVSSWCFMES